MPENGWNMTGYKNEVEPFEVSTPRCYRDIVAYALDQSIKMRRISLICTASEVRISLTA